MCLYFFLLLKREVSSSSLGPAASALHHLFGAEPCSVLPHSSHDHWMAHLPSDGKATRSLPILSTYLCCHLQGRENLLYFPLPNHRPQTSNDHRRPPFDPP